MSAEFYRAAAAELDRYAADVDDCDAGHVTPCRERLPQILQGAATAWLTDRLADCTADLRSAAAILRAAAGAARSTAAAIETAEAAAAAAEAEEPDPAPATPPLSW